MKTKEYYYVFPSFLPFSLDESIHLKDWSSSHYTAPG